MNHKWTNLKSICYTYKAFKNNSFSLIKYLETQLGMIFLTSRKPLVDFGSIQEFPLDRENCLSCGVFVSSTLGQRQWPNKCNSGHCDLGTSSGAVVVSFAFFRFLASDYRIISVFLFTPWWSVDSLVTTPRMLMEPCRYVAICIFLMCSYKTQFFKCFLREERVPRGALYINSKIALFQMYFSL